MNCNPCYKSCVRSYNDADQAFVVEPTQLYIEGVPVVDSGKALSLSPSGIRVNSSGIYHFSADVSYTPTSAGLTSIQFYRDGVALPCAVGQKTVAAGSVYTTHIETDLQVSACCVNRPVISVRIGGVTGTVNHICAGAVKLS